MNTFENNTLYSYLNRRESYPIGLMLYQSLSVGEKSEFIKSRKNSEGFFVASFRTDKTIFNDLVNIAGIKEVYTPLEIKKFMKEILDDYSDCVGLLEAFKAALTPKVFTHWFTKLTFHYMLNIDFSRVKYLMKLKGNIKIDFEAEWAALCNKTVDDDDTTYMKCRRFLTNPRARKAMSELEGFPKGLDLVQIWLNVRRPKRILDVITRLETDAEIAFFKIDKKELSGLLTSDNSLDVLSSVIQHTGAPKTLDLLMKLIPDEVLYKMASAKKTCYARYNHMGELLPYASPELLPVLLKKLLRGARKCK